jgi:hypothetical protein
MTRGGGSDFSEPEAEVLHLLDGRLTPKKISPMLARHGHLHMFTRKELLAGSRKRADRGVEIQ